MQMREVGYEVGSSSRAMRCMDGVVAALAVSVGGASLALAPEAWPVWSVLLPMGIMFAHDACAGDCYD